LEQFWSFVALLMPANPFEEGTMKAYHLTIAAAAAGVLLAAGSASATPLASKSTAAMGIDPLNAVEPVHYRRHRAARHYYPRYSYRAPAVTFGYAPVVTPYYGYPYGYGYRPYYPRYPHAYSYGYAPTFSFGFHLR
jgi:hypothetical protein